MNIYTTVSGLNDPTDQLLADVAIHIQLSRSDYGKAVQRYETINAWIDRDGSPLHDLVALCYPQGSMAIGATITGRRMEGFDIDVVAQLLLSPPVAPHEVLDALYRAIRGTPESRYYHTTKRRTRCVTVEYQDGMHVDVTPAIRRPETHERESWIFDHRSETPTVPGKTLIANPYGFAEWFKRTTPADHAFANSFESRAAEHERRLATISAESEPVPAQESPFRKSLTVISLQLLKRWRNVQYQHRRGRQPPAILLAKLVADNPPTTSRLADTLLAQAQSILHLIQQYHDRSMLIQVFNPVCPKDELTDRWPGSLDEQQVFISDLQNLVSDLGRIVSGCDLAEMRRIMVRLFGESPTSDVFQADNERRGATVRAGSRYEPGTGRLIVPERGARTGAAVATGTATTPVHTFFGERDRSTER